MASTTGFSVSNYHVGDVLITRDLLVQGDLEVLGDTTITIDELTINDLKANSIETKNLTVTNLAEINELEVSGVGGLRFLVQGESEFNNNVRIPASTLTTANLVVDNEANACDFKTKRVRKCSVLDGAPAGPLSIDNSGEVLPTDKGIVLTTDGKIQLEATDPIEVSGTGAAYAYTLPSTNGTDGQVLTKQSGSVSAWVDNNLTEGIQRVQYSLDAFNYDSTVNIPAPTTENVKVNIVWDDAVTIMPDWPRRFRMRIPELALTSFDKVEYTISATSGVERTVHPGSDPNPYRVPNCAIIIQNALLNGYTMSAGNEKFVYLGGSTNTVSLTWKRTTNSFDHNSNCHDFNSGRPLLLSSQFLGFQDPNGKQMVGMQPCSVEYAIDELFLSSESYALQLPYIGQQAYNDNSIRGRYNASMSPLCYRLYCTNADTGTRGIPIEFRVSYVAEGVPNEPTDVKIFFSDQPGGGTYAQSFVFARGTCIEVRAARESNHWYISSYSPVISYDASSKSSGSTTIGDSRVIPFPATDYSGSGLTLLANKGNNLSLQETGAITMGNKTIVNESLSIGTTTFGGFGVTVDKTLRVVAPADTIINTDTGTDIKRSIKPIQTFTDVPNLLLNGNTAGYEFEINAAAADLPYYVYQLAIIKTADWTTGTREVGIWDSGSTLLHSQLINIDESYIGINEAGYEWLIQPCDAVVELPVGTYRIGVFIPNDQTFPLATVTAANAPIVLTGFYPAITSVTSGGLAYPDAKGVTQFDANLLPRLTVSQFAPFSSAGVEFTPTTNEVITQVYLHEDANWATSAENCREVALWNTSGPTLIRRFQVCKQDNLIKVGNEFWRWKWVNKQILLTAGQTYVLGCNTYMNPRMTFSPFSNISTWAPKKRMSTATATGSTVEYPDVQYASATDLPSACYIKTLNPVETKEIIRTGTGTFGIEADRPLASFTDATIACTTHSLQTTTTISNTTSEEQLIDWTGTKDSGLISESMLGTSNGLIAGSKFALRCVGLVQDTGSPNITFRVYLRPALGAAVKIAEQQVTLGISAGPHLYDLEGGLKILAVGATGNVQASFAVKVFPENGVVGTVQSFTIPQLAGPFVIDMTDGVFWEITAQWDTANVSNTITSQEANIRLIYAPNF